MPDQFRDFLSAAASFRQDLFSRDANGTPQMARMEGEGTQPFRVNSITPVRSQEQLERALFHDLHDTIVRVNKSESACRAVIGKSIRLIAALPGGVDLVVVIKELAHSGVNPEWVLGCKNVF